MTDMSAFLAEETCWLHLRNPKDGKPLFAGDDPSKPVRIRIYGPASHQFAEVEARQQNRITERAARAAQAQAEGKESPEQSSDELAAERAQDLADLTAEFENFDFPPLSHLTGKALFAAIYRTRGFSWITPQFNKRLSNWGNFMPGSAES